MKEQYEKSLKYLTAVMIVASIFIVFIGLGILSSKSVWYTDWYWITYFVRVLYY